MKTNQLFICVVTLILFISISVAQEKNLTDLQRENLKGYFKEYFEKLALSDEQQTLFKKITIKYAIQIKALKNSNKPYSDKADAFKTIIDTKNKEMKILLFTEQYKIYKDCQESSIEKLMNLKARTKNLELSENQQPTFKEITHKYLLQIIGLKNSNKPNAAKADELKWMLNAKKEELRKLLSAKQFNIYLNTQKERLKKLEILKNSIEKLELAEDQESEFREITKKYAFQLMNLKASNQSIAAKADELKWILDAKNKEMKVLLSDKQYKTYKKTQQKRMKKLKKTT